MNMSRVILRLEPRTPLSSSMPVTGILNTLETWLTHYRPGFFLLCIFGGSPNIIYGGKL